MPNHDSKATVAPAESTDGSSGLTDTYPFIPLELHQFLSDFLFFMGTRASWLGS